MDGGKKNFSEKEREEKHNIIGTERAEGNFIFEGGKKPLRAPVLILRKSLHFVLR
jgi:hypothetical protein